MTSPLFRQQAIEEQRDRLYGEVVVAQPLSFAVIIMAVLLLVVIAGLYLFYGMPAGDGDGDGDGLSGFAR
jgi:hypothetical protein